MPTRTVFFDTSFVLALENKDDPHHERAKLLDKELLNQDAVLLLHWGILLEIADGYARISRRARGLQLREARVRGFTASSVDDQLESADSFEGEDLSIADDFASTPQRLFFLCESGPFRVP